VSERKDWCSNFPDEIDGIYYGHCCRRHDFDYSMPGDRHLRKIADERLGACISAMMAAKWGQKWGGRWGRLMLLGVRTFGWLPWHYQRTIWGRKLSDGERSELGLEFGIGGSADH